MTSLRDKRALVVGVGGLGSPAAIALARAGVGTIGLVDEDVVEGSNLHRQILFSEADIGSEKIDAAARALRAWMPPDAPVEVVLHRTRLLPDNARAIVARYDIVTEGSDNFATKFMTADACALERVPVVHGAAVRWHGTAFAVGSRGRPCYRCLFEDIPHEHAPNCAEAGVMGPIVGVVGALQADLALAMLHGANVAGDLVTFDGKRDTCRRRRVPPRSDCPLCGVRRIQSVDVSRYVLASTDSAC